MGALGIFCDRYTSEGRRAHLLHLPQPRLGSFRADHLGVESVRSTLALTFIVTYLENRCKLTLDECIALFPTVEVFQAAWF